MGESKSIVKIFSPQNLCHALGAMLNQCLAVIVCVCARDNEVIYNYILGQKNP